MSSNTSDLKGRVALVTGDGSLQMTIHELATIARHRLPVKILMFNNQGHGMAAVEHVVPIEAQALQEVADDAHGRGKHEQPQHARHHWGYGVRPDQQGFVDGRAFEHAVGHDGQQERNDQAGKGHQQRKNSRGFEGFEVSAVSKQAFEVLHTDKFGAEAKSVLRQHALVQGLTRWPKEKHQHHRHLGCDEEPGKPS